VGTIEERKGLIYVIKSMKSFRNKNFIFNVVGKILQQNYYNKLKHEIELNGMEKNVKFYGKVMELY
jgi:hypothetical protein